MELKCECGTEMKHNFGELGYSCPECQGQGQINPILALCYFLRQTAKDLGARECAEFLEEICGENLDITEMEEGDGIFYTIDGNSGVQEVNGRMIEMYEDGEIVATLDSSGKDILIDDEWVGGGKLAPEWKWIFETEGYVSLQLTYARCHREKWKKGVKV